MRIIDNWLAGKRNFYVGVAIFNVIGYDQKLKQLFTKGKTAFNEKELHDQLVQLNEKAAVIQVPVDEEVSTMPKSENQVLESIRQEWLVPYKRMNYLIHRLDGYRGNSEEMIQIRMPIAFEILALEQECMRLWKKRDYFLQHGQLPEAPKKVEIEIPADPVELALLIQAIKKGITRNRGLMKKNPDKPLYAQLYQEYLDKFKTVTGKEYGSKN